MEQQTYANHVDRFIADFFGSLRIWKTALLTLILVPLLTLPSLAKTEECLKADAATAATKDETRYTIVGAIFACEQSMQIAHASGRDPAGTTLPSGTAR